MAGKRDSHELVFKFPGRELIVNTNKMSTTRTREIQRLVAKTRALSSVLLEHPMEEGETLDDWQERAGKIADAEFFMRKDGESVEDHVARINTPKLDAQDMVLPLLNGVMQILEGKEASQITANDVEDSNWLRLKDFVFRVFQAADVWMPEYAPKRPSGKSD